MRAHRKLRPLATLLLVGVVGAACSGSGGGVEGPDPAYRRDAIREARAALGGPAVALASASETAVTALTLLREELPADPARRRSLADSVETEDVSPLQQAIRGAGVAAEDLAELDLGVADVDAALAAFASATEAATEVHAASREELDRVREVADADAELAAIVDAWAQGGSRSELLNRFAELSTRAQALAVELGADPAAAPASPASPAPTEEATGASAVAPPSDLVEPCAGAVARRGAAAVAVANASEELRQLVLRRRGNDLDTRLEELVDDPYGTGTTLVDLDRADAGCWAESDEVSGATAALTAALQELQDALNPSDLSEAPAES